MNTAAFDTLSFTKRLEEAGLNRKVAEALSLAVQEVAMQNVATKADVRSEEHTSELQSLMRISYAVFCLKKKKTTKIQTLTVEQRCTLHSTNVRTYKNIEDIYQSHAPEQHNIQNKT